MYVCALGGLPLFSSKAKFESGSGWPSFYEPIDSEHVIEKTDASFGMVRTEVLDARTSAHLGHGEELDVSAIDHLHAASDNI